MSKRAALTAAVAVVVVLMLVGGAVAIVAKNSHDKTVAAQKQRAVASSSAAAAAAARRAASQSAAASASSSASLAAEQKRTADEAERQRRKQIVDALQSSITKDAKKDVRDGLLDGPIKRTDCNPADGGSDDLLDNESGKFSCIAVNKDATDGTESGYRFSATVNWTAESYSWQLGS